MNRGSSWAQSAAQQLTSLFSRVPLPSERSDACAIACLIFYHVEQRADYYTPKGCPMRDKYNTSTQVHWSWTPGEDSEPLLPSREISDESLEDVQDDDISTRDDYDSL